MATHTQDSTISKLKCTHFEFFLYVSSKKIPHLTYCRPTTFPRSPGHSFLTCCTSRSSSEVCGRQHFASTLPTNDNRSATNSSCTSIITIGYSATKWYARKIYFLTNSNINKYKRGKIADTPSLFLPYKQVEMLHAIYPETATFRDTNDRQMARGIRWSKHSHPVVRIRRVQPLPDTFDIALCYHHNVCLTDRGASSRSHSKTLSQNYHTLEQ